MPSRPRQATSSLQSFVKMKGRELKRGRTVGTWNKGIKPYPCKTKENLKISGGVGRLAHDDNSS